MGKGKGPDAFGKVRGVEDAGKGKSPDDFRKGKGMEGLGKEKGPVIKPTPPPPPKSIASAPRSLTTGEIARRTHAEHNKSRRASHGAERSGLYLLDFFTICKTVAIVRLLG